MWPGCPLIKSALNHRKLAYPTYPELANMTAESVVHLVFELYFLIFNELHQNGV